MKKNLSLILILLTCTLLFPKLTYANEHDGGGSTPTPLCNTFNVVLSCEERETSVSLGWSHNNTSGSGFTVYWDIDPNRTTCPAGSPTTTCGLTTLVTNLGNGNFTALITGLTTRQSYKFRIKSDYTYTCKIGTSYETTQQVNITGSNICTPTVCEDNTKGTTEACDGTDFGTTLNTTNNQCAYYGNVFLQPNQAFEGGNLTCVNNSGVCQITTTRCNDCNGLSNVTASNGINNSGYVATNATFKCFVDAARAGPGIRCEVIRNIQNNPSVVSTCNFVSWQGTRAEFNCIAPSETSNSNAYAFGLRAKYPIDSGPTSGTVTSTNCPLQTKTSEPYNPGLWIVPPDTTPPTVSVTEDYSNYTNENPSTELKVTVSCANTDNGSSCYPDSYKLKRFDTQPASCPTNYADYNLTPPNTPAASKSVWYCAAAQDVLGNTGFSTPFEVRPGCRDECQPLDNRMCRFVPRDNNFNQESMECYQRGDTDTCYEWKRYSFCGEFCNFGTCGTQVRANGVKWAVGYGTTVDTDGKGIQGIIVRIRAVYNSNLADGATSYTNAGHFILYPVADNSSDGIYKGIYNISTDSPPPGYQLSRVVCIENKYSYTNVDGEPTGTCGPVDQGASCVLNIPFDHYDNSSYCGNPTLQFIFSKTDNTPPTGSLTRPATITPQTPATFSVTATDNIGVKNIEIYLDKALVKRCHINRAGNIYTPFTGGTCTYDVNFLSEDNHSIYAVITDTVGNVFTTPSQTFTVLPTPSPSPSPSGGGSATSGSCGLTNIQVLDALVTSPSIDGQSARSGDDLFGSKCIIDPKAAFAPFDIPTFNDLKSLYYDQSKSPKNTSLTSISEQTAFSGDTLYSVDGDLDINGSPTGSGTPIIFVNGNLNIAANYTYGSATTGSVFVVKGNIYIDTAVTTVDAVLISEGIICTASEGTPPTCPIISITPATTLPLTINGSLVSIKQPDPAEINPLAPISFRRSLTDNSAAAETINHQIKYLVILRNLFSDTWQKWSEIP